MSALGLRREVGRKCKPMLDSTRDNVGPFSLLRVGCLTCGSASKDSMARRFRERCLARLKASAILGYLTSKNPNLKYLPKVPTIGLVFNNSIVGPSRALTSRLDE